MLSFIKTMLRSDDNKMRPSYWGENLCLHQISHPKFNVLSKFMCEWHRNKRWTLLWCFSLLLLNFSVVWLRAPHQNQWTLKKNYSRLGTQSRVLHATPMRCAVCLHVQLPRLCLHASLSLSVDFSFVARPKKIKFQKGLQSNNSLSRAFRNILANLISMWSVLVFTYHHLAKRRKLRFLFEEQICESFKLAERGGEWEEGERRKTAGLWWKL